MAKTRKLIVDVIADASKFTSELNKADGYTKRLKGSMKNLGKSLAIGAAAGGAAAVTFGAGAIKAAEEAEQVQKRVGAIIKATGALVSNATFVIPSQTKTYVVWNATSGAYTLTIKTSGGTGIAVTQGKKAIIMCDGTDCFMAQETATATPAALGASASAGTSTVPSASDHVHQRQLECLAIAIGDETTAITTGTAKVTFRMPYAFTVTAVRASLTTVSSSGTPTFDINENGTTILSTKLTIDASEKTSTTAATAAVISDSALADDAEITIDVDTAGTGAAGAKIYIIGYRS